MYVQYVNRLYAYQKKKKIFMCICLYSEYFLEILVMFPYLDYLLLYREFQQVCRFYWKCNLSTTHAVYISQSPF